MKSKSKTKSVQTVTPPSWAAPDIQYFSGEVRKAYDAVPRAPYTGDYIAKPDDDQLRGLDIQRQLIPELQSNYAAFKSNADKVANYDFAFPTLGYQPREYAPSTGYGDGNLQRVIEAVTRPSIDRVQREVVPNLISSAIEQGAYGGSHAQSNLPALIADDLNRTLADTAARIGYEDYLGTRDFNYRAFNDYEDRVLGSRALDANIAAQRGQLELGRAGQVADLLRQAQAQALLPGQALFDVGTIERNFEQDRINEEIKRYEDKVNAPYQGLSLATQLIQALAQPYSTTTNVQKSTQTGSPMSALLGVAGLAAGALGGGGIASAFSSPGLTSTLSSSFMDALKTPLYSPTFSLQPISVPRIGG
jgi:hypothetical protein